MEVFVKFPISFLFWGYVIIEKLQVPSFCKGSSSPSAYFVEHYKYSHLVIVGVPIHNEVDCYTVCVIKSLAAHTQV